MALKAGFLHAAGQSACCTQTMMLNVGYLHGKLFPARQCFQQDSVSSRTECLYPNCDVERGVPARSWTDSFAPTLSCLRLGFLHAAGQSVMLNAGFLHAAG